MWPACEWLQYLQTFSKFHNLQMVENIEQTMLKKKHKKNNVDCAGRIVY